MTDNTEQPRARRCETCRFWDHYQNIKGRGCCRIRAPIGINDDDGWPTTRLDDWCGEWKEIEP